MADYIVEQERKTAVAGHYDVIVCGGGPAGVSAAVTAARSGAGVLLIEGAGCIGGIWTAGLLSLVLDTEGKAGLLHELVERLDRHAIVRPRSRFVYDAEAMKVELEELCREAGVRVRLHTRVVGAVRENGAIAAVMTESAGGREAFTADVFIDCTGSGDFAALAGCAYDYGHPDTGQTQPATLFALISGVPAHHEGTTTSESKQVFRSLLRSVGIDPSYQSPSLFRLPHPDICCLMINHEYNVRCDSADDITAATIRARRELFLAVQALRRLDDWRDVRLVATAEHIGIREGRRIRGRYVITTEDLLAGSRFDDAVCLVRFGVDVHSLTPGGHTGYSGHGIVSLPYHIPFRSLLARDCDNLLLAGRLISGDFFSHASYRVTGNAVPMGEAAGWAAAAAAQRQIRPARLDGAEVRAYMQSAGYEL